MAIEQVFRQHERPLGVDEVLKYGRKLVESLNQATVYRNLKHLIDDGWLKRIFHPLEGGGLCCRPPRGTSKLAYDRFWL
jgi:Fur family ferric uptake transcriptional regulator